jgi:hypothetical protein
MYEGHLSLRFAASEAIFESTMMRIANN